MRLIELFARCYLQLSWRLVNALFTLLQRKVWWCLVGRGLRTSSDRRDGARGQLERSVQVLKVVARYKMDWYLQAAIQQDFMTVHDRYETLDYLLRDNVTLYCVDENEATFVETVPGLDVWRASVCPFIMPAQFEHARYVLRVATNDFHRLADRVGNPGGKLVFLTNTARCGSTLLTQMFESTAKIVSISEPSSLNMLALISQDKKSRTPAIDRLVVSTVRLLCKPTSMNEAAYVIKLTAPAMQGLPLVASLFPSARNLFMYRDSLKVSQSLYRLSEELASLKTIFIVGKGSVRRLGWCVAAFGMPKDDYKFEINHDLGIGAMLWSAQVKNYIAFREQGIDIVAVRYEDIVADPAKAMRRIMDHCGITAENMDELCQLAVAALKLDSQRNTPLANERLARHRTLEYVGEAKLQCDIITDKLGAPRLGTKYIAPATITSD